MKDLRDYLRLLNQHQRLVTTEDIEYIFNILSSLFDVEIKGLEFVENDSYILSYDYSNKRVRVDYNSVIKYYFEKAKKSGLDLVSLINYYITFALIHEFCHEVQRSSELDSDIKKVYDLCFRYTGEGETTNKLVEMVRKMIYNKLHDYFAIEINANVIATEYLISILDSEYRNYFMSELYKMIKSCYIDFDLLSMYNKELLFDTSELVFDMSFHDKIRAGIYVTPEEREYISTKGNLRLDRIVNCKQ